MKRFIFVLSAAAVFIGTIAFQAETLPRHGQRPVDLTAAARIKPFSPANTRKDAAYQSAIMEADLLSLHTCQGSHRLFVSEPASADGLVDAQGAAECVVQLRSALREVPATHPAYPEIRAELAWWNSKLRKLDPADYHRLNS